MWLVYELLLILAFLLYLPKALWRRRLPHRGWSMRLGRYPAQVRERLSGREALWVHAVSVGEVLAARPLIQALSTAYPQQPLVLSTVTAGGFEVASKQAADQGAAVYGPLDLRPCVRRSLDLIRPRLLILMESELWPTMIRLTKARGVPIVVANGRISRRAFVRYRLAKPWLRGMLAEVELFLMQGQADADRIIALGAPRGRVRVMGSLKWDASLGIRPSPAAIQETAVALGLNGAEAVIIAGSTHRGEEADVLDAFRSVRMDRPARLIVAPRHLERVTEVEQLARQAGLSVVRLSQAGRVGRWDVGVVDTFGELPRYYGVATVVFVGGSLIPHGGQNPLEAAGLGKPILFGPSMENFAEITEQLLAHRAARQLAGRDELVSALREFLTHPAEALACGRRAQELVERSQGVAQRTLDAIRPFLAV